MKIVIYIFSLSIFTYSWANPRCDYHFTVSNATIMVRDDPQLIQQEMALSRGQNSPNGRCGVFRIFFGKGLANSYQRKAFSLSGKALNYNLHRAINRIGILKDFNDAVNLNEFIQGYSPEKFTTYHSHFYVAAPGNEESSLHSGIFYDVVQVSVYGYNNSSSNYLFEETKNMTLVFVVSKKIEVSLIEENGTFDPSSTSKVMDFGHITQGDEKGVDLRVVSNTPYQVKMSSMNNGFLKHHSEAKISYQLKVNNHPVGLQNTSAHPVTFGLGNPTSSAGDRYNLRVKITGSADNRPAGLYQDAITITAIAN